jgi:hypothetical protein
MPEDLDQRFETALEKVMGDTEIADTLASTKLDAVSVRAEAAGHREDVLERVAVWIDGISELDERLAEAREQLALYQVPKRFWFLAVVGCVVLVAGAAGLVYLAINVEFGFVFLLGLVGVPVWLIALPFEKRQNRASELRIPVLEPQREAAAERLDEALEAQLRVTVRETLNSRLTSFATEFTMLDDTGLEHLTDTQREVPTQSTERLAALMTSLSSGSIGLSGPRGCGKTTLIWSFADGDSKLPLPRSRRGLVVSAPVRYDPREFVLHLFMRLCEVVLGEKGLEDMRKRRRAELAAKRRRGLAWTLVAAGFLIGSVGGLMLLFDKTSPAGAQETGVFYLFTGATLLYAAFLMWLFTSIMRRRIERGADSTPESLAEEHLDEIRYQQTLASGWSGGFKLPVGVSLGFDSKLTSARTPMSLPEVVHRFRTYAGSLTEDHYWVIGIDELDKMESEEAARRFLNDIKGVFGVHGCYYLISVSEDAMSSFERRGLPFRDVFDSSFDAIERVGYLSYAESQDVLERRILGLPIPFHVLCHGLSGGLPRDLIRAARELVHQDRKLKSARRKKGEAERDTTLRELCAAVVGAELESKVAAAIVAVRADEPRPQREWLLEWLRESDATAADAEVLRTRCQKLTRWGGLAPAEDSATANLRAVGLEIGAFSFYAATLLDLSAHEFQEGELEKLIEGERPVVDLLARARQDFAVSPFVAWRSIRDFRKQVEWLTPWDAAPEPAPSDEPEGELVGAPR